MTTKTKKRLVVIGIFAAILAVSLGVSISIGYLGRTQDETNIITVGHGDQEISEEFSEPSEQTMAGTDITKRFSVENTGTVPLFVRLYAEFSDSEVAGKATITYKGENNTDNTCTWEQFKTGLSLTDPNAAGYISSDWRYMPESTENGKMGGYFYYTKAVPVGGKTPDLFDSVKVDFRKYDDQSSIVDDSNIDRITAYDMIVYSETVQTVETGAKQVTSTPEGGDPVTSTVYGYEYKDGEWQDAWKSFLKIT